MSCATALAAGAGRVWARDMLALKQVELVAKHDHYVLVGGYNIQLAGTLDDALRKGITLTFVQLFEAERPRSYWFAEDVAVEQRTLKLSYNALLRQYQLFRDSGHASFDSEAEALAALGDFADWAVLDAKQVSKQTVYQARVRMYLDTSQLAKPLQMNAFASSRWDMDSGWREWSFKP
ncbi:DUF4390 domain-containing protein [Parasulfuritortus cantonensis]|uniref:DUF4390 domain-containing protein n=1 Tax=Parasulfuritortus cantonensis TaxID=2528202 RepID=UPI001404E949|nr:DUF4390 domain-containing protein [Parasulfuritortus cantonensis]